MNKHLKLCAAILVAFAKPPTAGAQVDLTHLIYNADFEKEDSTYIKTTTERYIYQPEGWDVTYENGDANDLSILNAGDYGANVAAYYRERLSTCGDKTYMINTQHGTGQRIGLSQSITLYPGNYTIKADVFHFHGTNSTMALFAGTDSQYISMTSSDTWQKGQLNFTLTSKSTIDVGFICVHKDAGVKVVDGIDNITLTGTGFTETDSLRMLLTNSINVANTTARCINNDQLLLAIDAAQAVFNNASATAASLSDAIYALDTTITTVCHTKLLFDFTPIVINPSFEIGVSDGWAHFARNDNYGDFGVRRNGMVNYISYTTAGGDGDYLFVANDDNAPIHYSKFIKQEICHLPAGYYTLSADIAAAAGTVVHLIADTNSVVCIGKAINKFVSDTLGPFYLDENSSIVIGARSENKYRIDNFRLTYYPTNNPITQCYIRKNLSSTGWGTICLPFDALPDTTTTIYLPYATSTDGTWLMVSDAGDTLKAGMAYIFKKSSSDANDTIVTFTRANLNPEQATPIKGEYLVGLYESTLGQPFSTDSYILKDGTWYRVDDYSAFNLGANRASLWKLPAVTASKSNNAHMPMRKVATGIHITDNGDKAASEASAPMYNLSGQRISNAYHGIVIVNGKKNIK